MLIVHLFVNYAHVNLSHVFSSSWCQGLPATSACGSSWTFLFALLSGHCHKVIWHVLSAIIKLRSISNRIWGCIPLHLNRNIICPGNKL